MKNIFTLLLVSIVLFSCIPQAPKEQPLNTLTENEVAEGWKLLFNGTDLNNWKMYGGGEVTGWKIQDGIFENSGVGSDSGGDIVTKEKFQNFELYLEWKVAPKSNSGVFYHVQDSVTPAIYQSGSEYQLIDDNGWPEKLQADQYSGANYGMHAPQGAAVKPIEDWNTTRIVVNGAHVEHWLNNVKVVEYELWSDDWNTRKAAGKWNTEPLYGAAKMGNIGLQDHGGLTMFRNIKIKAL